MKNFNLWNIKRSQSRDQELVILKVEKYICCIYTFTIDKYLLLPLTCTPKNKNILKIAN